MNWRKKGKFKIQKDHLRYWSKLAKECYSINSNCLECDFIPQQFKDICNVKYYIPFLCEKLGKPKEKERG